MEDTSIKYKEIIQPKKSKEQRRNRINWKTRFKMTINTTYLSIITLHINGLNVPMKRHRVADWIKKTENLQSAVYKKLTLGQSTHID